MNDDSDYQIDGSAIAFCQIKLAVKDLDESLRFYRLLGCAFDVRGLHASTQLPGGIVLELDSTQIIPTWDPSFNATGGGSTILGFAVASPPAVDVIHAKMIANGFIDHLPPHRAPWGRRLALIDDPDGNPVAIMGPLTESCASSREAVGGSPIDDRQAPLAG